MWKGSEGQVHFLKALRSHSTFSTSSTVLGLWQGTGQQSDSQVWPHGQAQQRDMSDSVVLSSWNLL